MKYARQTQEALDRLDQSLAQLRNLVKRGDQKAALRFMEEGALKERFEELQNIISVSSTNPLGARGTGNLGAL
tara:strand:- start:61 stop:279 length:219 start_codon:yes stop_codon:yes gene_type:complete